MDKENEERYALLYELIMLGATLEQIRSAGFTDTEFLALVDKI